MGGEGESDSPSIAFKKPDDKVVSPLRFGTWSKDFGAIDYLMFQVGTANSIWVPLYTVSWGFNISVDFTLGLNLRWTLRAISASGPTLSGASTNFGQLPEWSGAVQPVGLLLSPRLARPSSRLAAHRAQAATRPAAGGSWLKGKASSKAAAARRTSASVRQRPTIWRPIGRPASVKPQGIEMAGRPVRVMA